MRLLRHTITPQYISPCQQAAGNHKVCFLSGQLGDGRDCSSGYAWQQDILNPGPQ
jgi:hypothetical protein